jgi:hypothetical protein
MMADPTRVAWRVATLAVAIASTGERLTSIPSSLNALGDPP